MLIYEMITSKVIYRGSSSMKYFILYLSLFLSFQIYAEENPNIIKIFATMIPNSGSFVAISDKARGRLLKTENSFKADRISVLAETFKTENSLRDSHLHKFISGGSELPNPRIDIINLTGKENKATATIVINGVKKDIQIDYIEKTDYVEATLNLKTSDFKLEAPSYLGVGVSEDVKVEIKYFWEVL